MLSKFETYLSGNLDIRGKKEKILLAVSGGIDSVAMFHLFRKSFREIGVAHCNFQLRGSESDGDEQFVRQMAEYFDVPIFVKSFDTKKFASAHGFSTQMAARELRYAWFEEIRREKGYDYIAVAHHQDDAIETFFINLSRGTGLSGLSGIKPVNGKVVRPMLCFSREEILSYVKDNKLDYREDSSNTSRTYLRNALRLDVIPRLVELNPGFRQTILNEMVQFDEINRVFEQAVEEKMKGVVIEGKSNDIVRISKSKLMKLDPLRPYLFQYLKKFGFNIADIDDICTGIQLSTNAVYFSPTHKLIREGEELLLLPKGENDTRQEYVIDKDSGTLDLNGKFTWTTANLQDISIDSRKQMAFIDYHLLSFPLRLRNWKKGDFFFPIGMKGRKKLSDFFTDLKLSAIQKEQVWVLETSGKIAWVVGKRLDDRYKVTAKTKKVLVLEYKGN